MTLGYSNQGFRLPCFEVWFESRMYHETSAYLIKYQKKYIPEAAFWTKLLEQLSHVEKQFAERSEKIRLDSMGALEEHFCNDT